MRTSLDPSEPSFGAQKRCFSLFRQTSEIPEKALETQNQGLETWNTVFTQEIVF